MEKYNLQTLSFLIGSFRDIVQSFGQNSKSVEFYKRQVYGLANIGQVNTVDILFVEDLIGMRNTNAVKWDKATEKIDQFIKAINETYGYSNDTSKIIALEHMERSGEISLTIKEKIYEVYGIDTKDMIKEKNKNSNLNFGEIPSSKQPEQIENINKMYDIKSSLKKLIDVGRGSLIKIRNSEAVCMSDPAYYSCELSDLLNTRHILRELSKGSSYQIGKRNTCGDPCHPYIVIIEDKNLMKIASQIDWTSVYGAAKNEK